MGINDLIVGIKAIGALMLEIFLTVISVMAGIAKVVLDLIR